MSRMPLARIVIAGTIRFALGSAPPLLVPELELLVAFFAAKVLLAVGHFPVVLMQFKIQQYYY
jgi:hypothetical protein